ncbi:MULTISPECIES: hypothetical protein [unclassified Paenibacillus]|uniref:hypothetical protein n=1 Tax=unclassified Paenibacillus TaxID=185978 RepID=UPI001AE4895F|nr:MULTISPECIES: hypothetical protein [unclassified Paenibacillus]MBP1155813.1 putative membrane protein [Paenibacillus sp. PvP091]MBP1168801.1 putative membrane protein [Paenibacillus sp. PvR098]MBP2439829.1 putative membrane protein [Paenibacillus sp. PvP052]
MWPIILAVAVSIFVILLELPTLYKKKQYKEMVIYSSLTISSLTIYTMQTLNYRLPNPLELISMMYKRFWFMAG